MFWKILDYKFTYYFHIERFSRWRVNSTCGVGWGCHDRYVICGSRDCDGDGVGVLGRPASRG